MITTFGSVSRRRLRKYAFLDYGKSAVDNLAKAMLQRAQLISNIDDEVR